MATPVSVPVALLVALLVAVILEVADGVMVTVWELVSVAVKVGGSVSVIV